MPPACQKTTRRPSKRARRGRARRGRPAPWPCRSGRPGSPRSGRGAGSPRRPPRSAGRSRRRAGRRRARSSAAATGPPGSAAEPGDQRLDRGRSSSPAGATRDRRRRPPSSRRPAVPTSSPAWVPPVADGRTTASAATPARGRLVERARWPARTWPTAPATPQPPTPMTYGRRPAAAQVGDDPLDERRRAPPGPRSRPGGPSRRAARRAGRPGSAGRSAGPDSTRWTSSPARAPAAAVSRQWFDQRRPVVTRRVGALGQGRADEELEVAQLVAAERERQQVLALDPDARPAAEGRREPRQRLQRRRPVEQREPREIGRVGRPGWHGADGSRPVSSRPMATRITPADRLTTVGQHAGHGALDRRSRRRRSGPSRLYSSIVSTAPGDKTRIHHHGDCETSIYILVRAAPATRGARPAWSTTFDAEAGDFVYIPAGEIHVEENASTTEPLVVVLTRNCPDSHVVYVPVIACVAACPGCGIPAIWYAPCRCRWPMAAWCCRSYF